MSGELQASAAFTYSKNNSVQPWTSPSMSLTVNGNKTSRNIVGITTAAPQEVSLGDVAGNGYVLVTNLAAISMNVGVTTPFQNTLKPGEVYIARIIGTKFYAQGLSLNVKGNLDVFVIDD